MSSAMNLFRLTVAAAEAVRVQVVHDERVAGAERRQRSAFLP